MPIEVKLSDEAIGVAENIIYIYASDGFDPEIYEDNPFAVAITLMEILDAREKLRLISMKDEAIIEVDGTIEAVVLGPDRIANIIQACVDLYQTHPGVFS